MPMTDADQVHRYMLEGSPVKAFCLSSGLFASLALPAATIVSASELSEGLTCSLSCVLISSVTSLGLLCLTPCIVALLGTNL